MSREAEFHGGSPAASDAAFRAAVADLLDRTPLHGETTDPASVLAPPGSIEGLAAGRDGGELWLVRSDIGAVQRHRVDNGRLAELLSSFVVPGLDRVAVGADAVWAFGDSDATGVVRSARSTPHRVSPSTDTRATERSPPVASHSRAARRGSPMPPTIASYVCN
jgi:hypothetical protein